jgi:hypothetical protein
MRSDGIGPAYAKANESSAATRIKKKDLQAWLNAVKTDGKVL